MADTALNRYLMEGTSTQRAAYTPLPATVATGQPLAPLWFETDTKLVFIWNSTTNAWVQTSAGAGFTGARISIATDTAISTLNANTAIPFDTLDMDTTSGAMWSGSHPTRLVVPTGAGKVQLRGSMQFTSSLPNNQFSFQKNGTTGGSIGNFPGEGIASIGAGGFTNPGGSIISGTLTVVPGDFYELAYFISGGTTLAGNSTRGTTWFEMQVVG